MARLATYKPNPKTVWLPRLLRQFSMGVLVRDEATPAPIAGCMTNSGSTTVTMPNSNAGASVGVRSHSGPSQATSSAAKASPVA